MLTLVLRPALVQSFVHVSAWSLWERSNLGLYSLKRHSLTGIEIPIINLRRYDDYANKTVSSKWIEALNYMDKLTNAKPQQTTTNHDAWAYLAICFPCIYYWRLMPIVCEKWKYKLPMHDDVIKLKNFPRYWPFVRGIHRPPVTSPHKGQGCGALMFSFISAWINSREGGDLRRHCDHYDVTVMFDRGYTSIQVNTHYYSALNAE